VPPATVGQSIDTSDLKENEIRVHMIPTYVIAIPLVTSVGELVASASISDLALKPTEGDGNALLDLRLNRSGNRSTYGDVFVTYASPTSGEIQVASLLGIVVYTPNPRRTLRLPLGLPDGMRLSGGTLHVVYRAKPDDGGEVLAEAELSVP
jgi:hypothetical protein